MRVDDHAPVDLAASERQVGDEQDTRRAETSTEEPTMAELLEQAERTPETLHPLRAGQTVEGTVARISGDEVLVDLGGRPAGVLSLREGESVEEPLEVGDRVVAYVVHAEGPAGHAVLSLRRARRERRWARMAELQRSGELVEAPVVEANRGGVVVDLGLRGFVPLSQLSSVGGIERPAQGERVDVPEPVKALVGKRLQVKVLEVDPRRNRLILSEKAAAQEVRRQRKARAAAELAPGELLEGTVTHVTGFGLFVDIGVADGLVHRSEITWDKAVNPMTIYRPGDRVHVVVTGVDRERERISLSIKQLQPDPWSRVGTELVLGQEVDATVTRLMPFGAFARIAEGLEGLIHVSELAPHRIAQPADAVQVGDAVRVRIIGIDPERRRLSLSVRQAQGR